MSKNAERSILKHMEDQKHSPLPTKSGAMKSMELAFVDIEGTGLDPRVHEIIEIAVVRVRQDWSGERPAFELVDEWSAKIRPENIASADPAALRVNGYTPTGWARAVPAAEALLEFSRRTEGAIMVAHNVAFDSAFIDAHLSARGIPNKMHYHRLDTVSMAYAKLHDSPDLVRYSLGELCKRFGIVNENAHSALSDARADYELFKKLLAL